MTARDRVVRLFVKIYGAALVVCPPAIRARYGDEMRRTFADACHEAAPSGMTALAGLLVRELADLARAALATRSRLQTGTPSPPTVRTPQPRSQAMSSLWHDLRYAARMLRRQPGFAVVAVLTLGLGIGATTAVFTVVNGVLLRPLPYHDPDRLVVLLFGRPGRASPWLSPLNYRDFVQRSAVFQDAAAFAPTTSNLTGNGEPERVDGASVSWNYFNVLGVTMRAGRGFVESDGSGTGDAAVISEALWQRRYGGSPEAVGSTIRLDGRARTIVGVAPSAVRLPADAEFWKPLIFAPNDLSPASRGAQWISVVARLEAGGNVPTATAALQTVAAQLAAEYERTNAGTTALAVPLHQRMVQNVSQTLLMLLGAVGFVLLISCVNVANLLLARAQARSREVAMRVALGASRSRLVCQFLAESILLGVLGAAAGLAAAFACTRGLVALGPATIPRLAELTIDLRVLAFTIVSAIATSVLFGLAPALAATGSGVARFVASTRGVAGSGAPRTRRALVVSELALAVVLLVGAGLLIRSYQRLHQVNPGFDPDGVITFNLSLPEAKYPAAAQLTGFTATLLARLQAEPGVEAAAAIFGLPFAGDFSARTSFRDPAAPDANDDRVAGMRIVTPDYFNTMRIPLVAGRLFDDRDDERGPEVVLINQQTARQFFAGQDPIGQQIRVGVRLARDARSNSKIIVGVVGDVKYGRLEGDTPAELYLPYAQHAVDEFTIAVRVAGSPMAFAPTLRRDVAAIDRDLPIAKIEAMTAVIGASIAERRFTMLLLTAFAVVAVALAAIGIYGVLAYLVGQRTQEIGVRLAIGATPRSVAALFVREGALLALAGLVCGLGGALAIMRVLASLLFGVETTDPATFAAVAAALALVAMVASYVPARRAARVDPIVALRGD